MNTAASNPAAELTEVAWALFWEKVDKEGPSGCWLWLGAIHSAGYGTFSVRRVTRYAHRLSFAQASGEGIPAGMQVDHMCHNRACVNPDHLQLVTNQHNSENLRGPTSRSTSGYRGVTWDKREGKWKAHAHHDGRSYSGGYFSNIEDANEAAIALRCRLMDNNLEDRKAAS